MKRFIKGENRHQSTLFPESLDEYIHEENPVRVIDVFVDELDLSELGFQGVIPKETGRPSYHPSTMLKLYAYGYLNRIQSSRRLERETQRNVELMWLTERLTPDFKTIADFRKNNGKGIQNVCRQFIDLCRHLELFTDAVVAIDGSKFKAVNNRDQNFTKAKMAKRMEKTEENIARYLNQLDKADSEDSSSTPTKQEIEEKIVNLKGQMCKLKTLEEQRKQSPDQQVSLTDPDSRSMTSGAKGKALVGYNLQAAVDIKNHLIVSHKMTNKGSDRDQLCDAASLAQKAMGKKNMTILADKGYYKGEEILAVTELGMKPLVPKALTSGSKKLGRFGKQDFQYVAEKDEYQCPAGQALTYRCISEERGMKLKIYWSNACQDCTIKDTCTSGKERRIKRWEHEQVLDDMEVEFENHGNAMLLRKQTVEHPFGTIKYWMGATHFQMRTLKNVRTEMSLHVLAYNLKRVMSILGVKALTEAIQA